MRTRVGRWGTGLAALVLVPAVGPASAGATVASGPGSIDRRPAVLNLSPPMAQFRMLDGRGDLVGSVVDADQQTRMGEWQQYGQFVDFGTTGGTYVHGMNNRGHVIGDDEKVADSGFLWHAGRLTYLTADGLRVWTTAVSNRDVVVGELDGLADSRQQAFSWRNGVFTRLSTPDGMLSSAVAVNDRGQILGSVIAADWSTVRGALWDHGRLTLIGGTDTTVRAINNRGQVIGFSAGRPFLWSNGRMRDLLAGTGATSGWAEALSDSGVVIGEADSQAVIWTATGMRRVIPSGYVGGVSFVNRRGDVAGGMVPATGGDPTQRVLFRWRDGVLTYYGAPAGATCGLQGIDDHGRLFGYLDTDAGRQWVTWGADRATG